MGTPGVVIPKMNFCWVLKASVITSDILAKVLTAMIRLCETNFAFCTSIKLINDSENLIGAGNIYIPPPHLDIMEVLFIFILTLKALNIFI